VRIEKKSLVPSRNQISDCLPSCYTVSVIETMPVINVTGSCKCFSLSCDLFNAKHLTANLQYTVILNLFAVLLLLLGGLNVVSRRQ